MEPGYLCLPSSYLPINKMIQVIVLFVMCSVCLPHPPSIRCSQPSSETLQQQHSNISTHSEVFFPIMDGNTISTELVTQRPLDGDSECPKTPASGRDDPVESRALCPWKYDVDDDPARYPKSLAVAKCLCEICIYNNVNLCEPVTYNIIVLKQTEQCENGYYVYEPQWVQLPVGCTCAMPITGLGNPTGENEPEIR